MSSSIFPGDFLVAVAVKQRNCHFFAISPKYLHFSTKKLAVEMQKYADFSISQNFFCKNWKGPPVSLGFGLTNKPRFCRFRRRGHHFKIAHITLLKTEKRDCCQVRSFKKVGFFALPIFSRLCDITSHSHRSETGFPYKRKNHLVIQWHSHFSSLSKIARLYQISVR